MQETGGPISELSPTLLPIFKAADSGDFEQLQKYTEESNDISIADASGDSLLHHAACNGHIQFSKFLLANNLNVEVPGENDMTPHYGRRQKRQVLRS